MKKTLITRRKALITGAGALGAPFVITSPGFGQTGPIKLSGLVSLTGSGAPFGPNSRMAHQAVVDQVNAAGGLLGRKIEYLAEDDATNPEAYGGLPKNPRIPWVVRLWKGPAKWIGNLAMLGGILGVTLHYLRFGPKRVEDHKDQKGGQP